MISPPAARDTVVVIDDDRSFRESISEALESHFDVLHATTPKTGMMRVEQGADAVLLDIRFGKEPANREGLELLEAISALHPGIPVIMMTGYADMETAIRALQGGAADFIQKESLDVKHLSTVVTRAIQRCRQQSRLDLLEKRVKSMDTSELIGSSALIRKVRDEIAAVAMDRNSVVLLSGETGTGKEVAARMLHSRGPRASGPFITVSAPALSAERIESELFGCNPSTPGTQATVGLAERAHHGVLFLDGVSEIPMALQGKLLRAIETGEFCRAGSADTQKADIQVIAATHEDLRALADAGRFRQDLLYRLKGFEISMPPLRAIPGDIASLSENFLHAARAAGRIRVQGIADSVIECLCAYRFPGNVRELRAIIERAAVIAQARSSWFIEEQDLPADVREAGHPASAVAITWNGQGPIQIDRELARAELGMHQIALAASMGRKQHAASLVGLPHRHSLPRRVARLRRDFPEVLAEFPEIGRQFAANGADPEGNES